MAVEGSGARRGTFRDERKVLYTFMLSISLFSIIPIHLHIIEGAYNLNCLPFYQPHINKRSYSCPFISRYIPVRYAGGLRHWPDYTSLRSGCLLLVQFTFPISKIAGSFVISILF